MQAELPNFTAEGRGFLFPNDFASAPALVIPIVAYGDAPIGNVANGLCGGMAFATLHFFQARGDPPAGGGPPLVPTSPLPQLVAPPIRPLPLPHPPHRPFP